MLVRAGISGCVALALALTAGGCGGPDYRGAVEVPRGYETVREAGVSFVRPAAFHPADIRTRGGLHQTQYGDPRARRTPQAFVSFGVLPGARPRFESLVEQTRAVIESTDGEVKVREIEVPGAVRAYRSTVKAPHQQGSDPADVHSEILQILLRDGTYVSLAAGAPDRDEDDVDVDAVLGSLRVERTR
jgi:hypothetical protein